MKKISAILLSIIMVMCYMPTMAFATGANIGSAVFSTITDKEYTGSAIEPEFSVKVGDIPLTKTTDYKVDYGVDNISVGTKTITITGVGGYEGTATTTFKIVAKNVNKLRWVPVDNKKIGDTITDSDVVLMDGNKVLKVGTDYTYTAPEKIGQGSNAVVITGKENYTGTRTVYITGGKDLSTNSLYEVKLTPYTGTSAYEYSGSPKTYASISVKDVANNRYLILNDDYTVIYKNNIEVGTATVTVKGIGEYAGTQQFNFDISQKSIKNVTVGSIENQVAGDQPKPTVKDGSKELVEGIDFYYTYDQGINTGIVTINGINNYKGVVTRTYNIKESIYPAIITLSNTTFEYSGAANLPSVKVLLGNKILTNGIDYKLVYENNVNVGTASVSVIGIGNYGGTSVYKYKITTRSLNNATVSLSATSLSYNGTEQRPSVYVVCNGRTLNSNDYDIQYVNNVNIGKATVYVTGKGNYTGSAFTTFQIYGKSISGMALSVSQDLFIYDGTAKRPLVTVKDGNRTLSQIIDYTVEYRDNVKAGTASVVVTGKGTYSGSITKTFTIKGYDQTVSTKFTRYTKYPTSNSFNLAASASGDGNGFTYRSSNESVVKVSPLGTVEIVGTGIATITVATTGTTKYDPASKTVTVTVKPNKAVISRAYSPASGKLKVAIKKAPGVTKYQVKYGRNGSYKNFYYKYSTNPNYMTQAKTFKGLDNGKAYFVKVRAYKTMDDGTKVWGNWSKTRKVYVR